jgi:hypothetical protein
LSDPLITAAVDVTPLASIDGPLVLHLLNRSEIESSYQWEQVLVSDCHEVVVFQENILRLTGSILKILP